MIDAQSICKALQQQQPSLECRTEAPLAPYSTVKIGGPADVLVITKTTDELVSTATYARAHSIPLTILGWGANTLISDEGIRGIVVIHKAKNIQVLDETAAVSAVPQPAARWQHADGTQSDQFDYYTGVEPRVVVELESGTPLPYAINTLLNQGITGLEWFSRIPATIGGAIYNNIHGAGHFLSEAVVSVTVLNEAGEKHTVPAVSLEFEYDYSRFHHTTELILSAKLLLYRGNVEEAKAAAIEWAKQKQIQPQNSLGCVFHNLDQATKDRLKLPTTSVGYFIDQVLKLSGFRIGDAQISPKHAAFIENTGAATAADYLAVIKTIQQKAAQEQRVVLQPEIFFRGFEPSEITSVTQPIEREA